MPASGTPGAGRRPPRRLHIHLHCCGRRRVFSGTRNRSPRARDHREHRLAWLKGMGIGQERFDRLYEEQAVRVYNLLRRLLANDQDAEDATVETFRRAYQGMWKFRGECTDKVWIMRIAHRVAARAHALQAKRAAVSLDAVNDGPGNTELRAADCPESAVLNRALVEEMLRELSQDQRVAVWLRVALEYTDEEVAQILQVPVGTVKSWVWRSLVRMRRACAQSGLQTVEAL